MNKKATIFEFISYKFEPAKKRILFNYKTEFEDKKTLFFTETVILPKILNLDSIDKKLISKLLEGLHIILGISYYKLYPVRYRKYATKIKLNYSLSKKEADFWNTVYKKGLGEFFYKNKLDPEISPKFSYKKTDAVSYNLEKNNKCLVGIGGGKDSIIAIELLKENNFDITAFFVQTNKKPDLIDNIINATGIKSLKIKRFLDPKVFEHHTYNGHVPISAIYAFLGILTAVLYKYSYFIAGNEYSSNFGNTTYKGLIINHQWSKSFEFEKLFQDYVSNFISPDVFYFSLLRPFYEIRIVKMFSKFRKFFSVFSSCNGNFKLKKEHRGLWCGQCSKCVFVFILLSAFLTKKDLINIFKKNLYQNKNLLPLFKNILGFGKMKPFDCVGTFEEAQTALYLAKNKYKSSFIVSRLLGNRGSSIKSGRQLKGKIKYYPKVFRTNKESNIPEQFKFLGMESALILGYGKEGRITKKYLKEYYPKIKIRIADIKQGQGYLKNQKYFDIAVKTPGINKNLVKIPYTTATNIFFSEIKGSPSTPLRARNLIIGVTGSKGKSTTASLIFKILKTVGRNVKFLGNIGKPMLESLSKNQRLKTNTHYVLELSSAQLDDIKFSPDIAVVTNLFPEHMDYHGNIENYYNAKKNIINYQNKDNYFVYDSKNKTMLEWLNNYEGKVIPFTKNIPMKDEEVPLIGEHNKNNIRAAISVAKILNIEDEIIIKTIKSFKGLPHRLEFIGEFKKIKFYDDAISTTPESTIMAIKSLNTVDTIFLGGKDRGYNFSQLEKVIKKHKIRNIVLFPDSGDKILKSVKGLNILKTDSMKEAVAFAYKNTKKGYICLLSCASPSYSLWKNFEEKGNQFQKFVRKFK